MSGLRTWPGLRTGVAIGLLGLLFMIAYYAVQAHAARGALFAPGEPAGLPGSGAAYVVGLVSAGADARETTRCEAISGGDIGVVEVGVRTDRSQSILAGQRLPAGTVSVVCDQRFSVSTGPAVLAYPVAGASSLFVAYLAVTAMALAVVVRGVRARRASDRGRVRYAVNVSSAPVPSGHGIVGTALFSLAVVGTMTALTLSVVAGAWAYREVVQNLLVLLVVLPAAVGAGILFGRRRKPATGQERPA